ncbi:hypothetical protein DL771_005751 [Monosporascus sp. 5C6A]|nr:hypothetical protein DL771_005751 [Monosporascus sp. 5C6A]
MAPPPIVNATIQSAVLAATSNFLAQALMAYRKETPLVIDWVPMFQFVLFALISTPPNFLWQEYLETTFPAYHSSPTREAVASAAAGDEKELEREAREGRLVEPRLNIGNTAAKFALDQTAGAAVNTFLFSAFMHSIQAAMAGPPLPGQNPLVPLPAIDYARVDWAAVLRRSRAEFFTLLSAGWRLWPLVSLVNFTLVKSVEGRNLLAGLAGLAWGVYVSLIAAS